ncbi:MAG TPA: hypothetical protein VHD33_00040 [Legionellaceae bacterium]|nr:hypothetical protein [Legionellaceae bacterium]
MTPEEIKEFKYRVQMVIQHTNKLLGFANMDDEEHAEICGDIEEVEHLLEKL